MYVFLQRNHNYHSTPDKFIFLVVVTNLLPKMGILGPVLHNTAIAALVITPVAVLLRFYTRIFIQHKFAANDWLVLVC